MPAIADRDGLLNHGRSAGGPARRARAVTPDDAGDLPVYAKALYLGTGGNVRVLTVDGKPVSRETVQGVQSYMTLYFLVTLVSVLLVALDNLDFVTTFTAVMATLNNIGPGLGLVGPTGCFAAFSPLAKIVLTADMLFGRLELFPMLILLMPSTWRKY